MNVAHGNLLAGWLGFLGGVASGAIIGLYFHREEWAGGYASFRRRMIRLGHLSFFGIGLLNISFAVTVAQVALPAVAFRVASPSLVVAQIAMPAVCFATAWRKSLRHLFFVPVAGVLAAVVSVLLGWH